MRDFKRSIVQQTYSDWLFIFNAYDYESGTSEVLGGAFHWRFWFYPDDGTPELFEMDKPPEYNIEDYDTPLDEE